MKQGSWADGGAFSLEIAPAEVILEAGGTSETTITVGLQGGSATLVFAADNIPNGIQASFTPAFLAVAADSTGVTHLRFSAATDATPDVRDVLLHILGPSGMEVTDTVRLQVFPAAAAAITQPPVVVIGSGPSGLVHFDSAAFTFAGQETDLRFECSLDSGEWTRCVAPVFYTNLGDGSHEFRVAASRPVPGSARAVVSQTWTVDTSVPDQSTPETTVFTGPPLETTLPTAHFEFVCDKVFCTFQCALDGGAAFDCISPWDISVSSGANHAFEVLATDRLGNQESTPARWAWRVAQ